ncbi:MAG: protease modulator HflC [Deltaproteobacteria bacterium]|nr:protease modulator HflC [Deltaproteobacteria bacterium]
MRRLLFVLLVLSAIGAALIWLGEVGWGPVVITHEDEQKIVLFLGSPISVRAEPGISLRPPFAEVHVFDRRFQYLGSQPQQMQTRDAERPVIDHYVVWRIADPLRFFSDFPQGMQQAEAQVDRIARSDVRDVVGQRTMQDLVADARNEIMTAITEQSAGRLREFGIEVRDVRINRVELPETTEANVFARMRAERERLARKYRAEGEEEGRRIRAEADRDARVTVAEARKQAEILRGEGDAEAARVYAEAHTVAPDFYGFVRRLDAYRKTIGEGTTLVLPTDEGFFDLLSGGRAAGAPPPLR